MQAFQTLFIILAIAGAVAAAGNRLHHLVHRASDYRIGRASTGGDEFKERERKVAKQQRQLGRWAVAVAALLGIALSMVGWGTGSLVIHTANLGPVNASTTLPRSTQPFTASPLPRSELQSELLLVQATSSESSDIQDSSAQPSVPSQSENEALGTAEVAPIPQPSRWQRMQGFLFVFYILVLSGVIATVGDRLGYRIGKKRLSWFNLRPRHTAILVTILTGIFISASSVGVLLLTNQSIADALFNYTKRVTQLQTEIQTLEGDITSVQAKLATLESERLEAENRVQQLTAEQTELRTLKAAVEDELATANQSLETTREQLNAAQTSLNIARQETARAEEAATAARERVNQLQASLLSTEEELSTLQTQKVDLEADIANLVAVAERLRRGEFSVLAGEPLATGVIEGGMTPGDIQQALNSLFALAERRARTLGATPTSTGGRAIQIRVPEVTRVIQEVSSPGSWVVQVFSLTNRLVGEPVPVITGVIPNRLLFTEGTVLSETSITPGGSDEDIEETLVRLFLEAGQKSRNEGILFDTSTGTVGEFPQSRLFELVQTLRRIDEPVNVQVVAQRDIYTSGPLEVDLQSNGVALAPDSSDTDDNEADDNDTDGTSEGDTEESGNSESDPADTNINAAMNVPHPEALPSIAATIGSRSLKLAVPISAPLSMRDRSKN